MNCKIKKINFSMKGLVPVSVKLSLSQQNRIIPFCVDGQFPTYISKIIETDLQIQNLDIKLGDYIIEVNGQNVSRASSKSVQKLIIKSLSASPHMEMLIYRNINKNSTVSHLLNSNTNDLSKNISVQEMSLLSCFKKIFGFKSKKVIKNDSIDNKTTTTNITKETNLTKTNNSNVQVDNIQLAQITNNTCVFVTDNKTYDTEDYGYHSIPQESQLDSQTSLDLSFDESIKAASTAFYNNNEQNNIEESVELFINKIQSLIEIYIRPLIALNILNKSEYLILFQNMEKLVPVTKYLLQNIIQNNDYTNSSLKTVFETYETYLCGLPDAIKLLKDLLVYHEEFYLFLKTLKDSCKIVLFDFIFLPFKFVNLISSFFRKINCEFSETIGLYKLNQRLERTRDLLNDISKTNDDTEINSASFSSTKSIFTENNNSINTNNFSSDEILFQDSIMVKISVKSDWKKAKILLFNNRLIILNKYTQEVYKTIKLNRIKTIKNCLNSNLDIDLTISETNNHIIKVHFSNTLSKNIWYQLTQVQLNYYNNNLI